MKTKAKPVAVCDSCERRWSLDALDEIKDFAARTEPGQEIPAGQCPAEDCGSLCYIYKPKAELRGLLKDVKRAHDALSEAAEDPDGSNDTEHEKAVELMEALNAYYQTVGGA